MKLRAYLKAQKIRGESLVEFAGRCETSAGQIKQVAGGYRRAGEKLAINIERETDGQVRCEDLRPDVDWAYLRASA